MRTMIRCAQSAPKGAFRISP